MKAYDRVKHKHNSRMMALVVSKKSQLMLVAAMLVLATGAAVWFLFAGPSESEFEVAEKACLSWIPGEEGMTDASVYDRRTKNGKIVIEVSGYISRLDGNFVVKCVYDPENRRMLRPGAFDSAWD